MKKLLGFISFLLVLAGSVSAKVVLPAIFSDNMVLQQNAQSIYLGRHVCGIVDEKGVMKNICRRVKYR